MKFIALSWLPGGNLQTIWPAMVSARASDGHARGRVGLAGGAFADLTP